MRISRRFRYEYTRPVLFRRRFLAAVCSDLAHVLAHGGSTTACASDADVSQRNDDHCDPVPAVALPHVQSLLHRVCPASFAPRVSDLGELPALRRVDAYPADTPGGLSAYTTGPV